MSESPTYRLELELILDHFGHTKKVLSINDVIEYTGKSRHWCSDHLGLDRNGCTVVQLASALSNMSKKKQYHFSF